MVLYSAHDIEQKHLGFAIGGLAASSINEQVPDLRGDFPNCNNWKCDQRISGSVLVVTFEAKDGGIPHVGEISADVTNRILAAAGRRRTYRELRAMLALAEFFSPRKLLFIVDLIGGEFEWDLAGQFVIEWLNDLPLPHALALNESRILRAIPAPLQYSQHEIFRALWVLECDEICAQGSAFELNGVGLVTCEHVISGARALRAFHPSEPTKKHAVRIIKANHVVDLAILDVETVSSRLGLLALDQQSNLHDHALVCGFPNYRVGDQGVFSPGVIIGTRQQSGVRRLLTNAPIVRGMSGGPAIGRDNKVIGVCVTGTDRLATADDTEDKSIIPIDALGLLT
jgi:hypothetical protein